MLHTKAWDGIKPGTTIAADVTITGPWLDLGNVQGSLSLSLYDANGTSTSMDLTYQVGVFVGGANPNVRGYQELSDKLTAATPADAGSIGSNVDCNAATNNIVHDTLTLPDGRYFRFLVHNDIGEADALVDLVIEGQI